MNPEFSFERITQPISETLGAEIQSLWDSQGLSIPDVTSRLAQVRYLARSQTGEPAGVCSSTVEKGIFNGLLFHSMRVMVAGEFRQHLLAYELLAHLVEELCDSRQGELSSEPVGAKVVIQTPIVAERGAIHCSRTFQFPINKTPKAFVLSGFTSRGHPEYCHYFLDENKAAASSSTGTTASGLTVARLDTNPQGREKEAILVLLRESPLGADPTIERRLLYTLKSADQLLAVCELIARPVPELNAGLLGIYSYPTAQADGVNTAEIFAREIYQQLAAETRSETPEIVGLYQVCNNPGSLAPVCPDTGFHFHGLDPRGRELRVRFFDEVKVKVPLQ